MTFAPSKSRAPLRAVALLIGIVAAPAACTINLAGIPSDGAGGATPTSTSTSMSASTSGTGGSSSTSSSGSTGAGGAMPVCVAGTTTSCYGGPSGTAAVGICKAGVKACKMDGSGYDVCVGEVTPQPENCFVDGDEDCDGTVLACTGTTLLDGALQVFGDESYFAAATDPAGNLLLGGLANSSVSGGVTVSNGIGGVSRIGAATGLNLWTRTFFTAGGYSVVRGVASDMANDVIVVGEFQNAMLDKDAKLNNAGGADAFLIKLDPVTDKVLCQGAFGDGSNQAGTAVAVDANGNIFITGTMGGSANFGGSTLTAMGSQNVFVAKFDAMCKHMWSKRFGDSSAAGHGLAVTSTGDVVVVGGFQGNIDFGKGQMTAPGNMNDVFVAKLAAADGAGLWSKHYGDDKDQIAYGVAVGSDGNMAVTGTMFGKCDFGSGGPPLDAMGNADAFVARLHADGTPDWSLNYGSPKGYQAGLGVAIDAQQHIIVAGYYQDTITLATTKLMETPMSKMGASEVFVAKLSSDGKMGWARSFGDINDQKAWAVATDSASNVIVAGTFEGGINFGGPGGQLNAGGYDGFWVKLAP